METKYLDREIKILESFEKAQVLTIAEAEKLNEYKSIQKAFKVVNDIENWANERDLIVQGNEKNQFNKTIEEVAEIAEVLYDGGSDIELMSESGGTVVTLIILLKCKGISLFDAMELEFNRISNREGEIINGTFVKKGKSNSKKTGYSILISLINNLKHSENG